MTSVAPVPEVQTQPEGNKPPESKPTVRQRFKQVQQRVTGTVEELRKSWEKMSLAAEGISLDDEKRQMQLLEKDLEAASSKTGAQLGVEEDRGELLPVVEVTTGAEHYMRDVEKDVDNPEEPEVLIDEEDRKTTSAEQVTIIPEHVDADAVTKR